MALVLAAVAVAPRPPANTGKATLLPGKPAAAVLAWAKLRCDPALELAPAATRADTDDVLATAASLDALARATTKADVCGLAIDAAGAVAVQRR